MTHRPGRRLSLLFHCVGLMVAVCATAAIAPASMAQANASTQADSAYQDTGPVNKKAAGGFGLVPGRFTLTLGAYVPNVQTSAKLSTQTVNGSEINFNHRLGLSPTSTSFDVGASWRISDHNYLSVSYFSFSRSSTKTLSDSLVWGDNVYHAGATLDVNNKVGYYGIAYRYYIGAKRTGSSDPASASTPSICLPPLVLGSRPPTRPDPLRATARSRRPASWRLCRCSGSSATGSSSPAFC